MEIVRPFAVNLKSTSTTVLPQNLSLWRNHVFATVNEKQLLVKHSYMCSHTMGLQNKRLAIVQDRGLEYNNTTL